MRQVLSLTAVCTICCSVAWAVQPRTVTVGNQWALGVSKTFDSKLCLGLPFPSRRAFGRTDTSEVRRSGRVFHAPIELGSDVEWGLYDVTGRLIENGSAHIRECGARDIHHTAAAGVYLVELHSKPDPSVRRTMLIVVP